MLPLTSPRDASISLAERAKQRRLVLNLSRKTLAAKSGVSEASIKRFETSGEIALLSLLNLALVLECMNDFDQVFAYRPIVNIDDIKPRRERGRT